MFTGPAAFGRRDQNWHTVWLTTRLRFTPCSTSGGARFQPPGGDPAAITGTDPAVPREGTIVKQGIHPEYVVTQVTCSCGNTFTTRSSAKSGQLHAEVCSACHPFYTGKQKIMDVGGRVDRFEKRYGKRQRSTS